MKYPYVVGVIIVILLLGVIAIIGQSGDIDIAQKHEVDTVTLYKSPNCGCCSLYSSHLRKYGFQVKIKEVDDMDSVKSANSIPQELASCHTLIVANNVVEGHVPIEAIDMLLNDDSSSMISLPGMPSGSPGMPGAKMEEFTIYSFSEQGDIEEYITI